MNKLLPTRQERLASEKLTPLQIAVLDAVFYRRIYHKISDIGKRTFDSWIWHGHDVNSVVKALRRKKLLKIVHAATSIPALEWTETTPEILPEDVKIDIIEGVAGEKIKYVMLDYSGSVAKVRIALARGVTVEIAVAPRHDVTCSYHAKKTS